MSFTPLSDAYFRYAKLLLPEDEFFSVNTIFNKIEDSKNSFVHNNKKEDLLQSSLTDSDILHRIRRIVSAEDHQIKIEKSLLILKLVTSISQFRIFIIQHEFILILKNGEDIKIPANEFFIPNEPFLTMVSHRFDTYMKRAVCVQEDHLRYSLNKTFGKSIVLPEESQRLKNHICKDDEVFCMHDLFGNFKYQDVFHRFPHDRDYDNDKAGIVVSYIEDTYQVSFTFIQSAILPPLRRLKKQHLI